MCGNIFASLKRLLEKRPAWWQRHYRDGKLAGFPHSMISVAVTDSVSAPSDLAEGRRLVKG